MSKQAFDAIATSYDQEFTETLTGRLQREIVYQWLGELLEKQKIQSVLELNCGTGEDAIWLVRRGCQVLATDISESMVAVARQKRAAIPDELAQKVQFKAIAAESIATIANDKKFDLIFSNFGGLNCLSPVQMTVLVEGSAQQLRSGGWLVMIVMGRKCIWETLYFLLKGRWGKAWRRRSKEPITAQLSEEESILTWYYGPEELYAIFSDYFHYKYAFPIGLVLPPSYLDTFFRTRTSWLQGLRKLEKKLGKQEKWANYADHFMMVLQKK